VHWYSYIAHASAIICFLYEYMCQFVAYDKYKHTVGFVLNDIQDVRIISLCYTPRYAPRKFLGAGAHHGREP